MNTAILEKDKDPMGAAILDYLTMGKAGKLRVMSTMFDDDEMPIDHLFREYSEMPDLEKKALGMACGSVLDVGAGAGCHTLALQNDIGKNAIAPEGISSVKAIDISPLSCEAMKLRGINNVECINVFDPNLRNESAKDGDARFDTILLLMNGTGIAGKTANMPNLLARLKGLLRQDGKILVDSSDIKYVYENEDGSFDIDLNAGYYGEVDYQMAYDGKRKGKNMGIVGEAFDWLYIDFQLLRSIAESCGLRCQLVAEGNHYDYLAQLTQADTNR